tara:strand:- start:305 stop:2887 length:2583 start_codon:yes stop_codon:yes gene_type:complete
MTAAVLHQLVQLIKVQLGVEGNLATAIAAGESAVGLEEGTGTLLERAIAVLEKAGVDPGPVRAEAAPDTRAPYEIQENSCVAPPEAPSPVHERMDQQTSSHEEIVIEVEPVSTTDSSQMAAASTPAVQRRVQMKQSRSRRRWVTTCCWLPCPCGYPRCKEFDDIAHRPDIHEDLDDYLIQLSAGTRIWGCSTSIILLAVPTITMLVVTLTSSSRFADGAREGELMYIAAASGLLEVIGIRLLDCCGLGRECRASGDSLGALFALLAMGVRLMGVYGCIRWFLWWKAANEHSMGDAVIFGGFLVGLQACLIMVLARRIHFSVATTWAAVRSRATTRWFVAVRSGNVQLLRTAWRPWLTQRCDPLTGHCALTLAATCGHLEAVAFLIERGEHVDQRQSSEDASGAVQNTALHIASRSGNAALVQMLLGKAARTNVRNSQRETPLHLAAEQGHLNVVDALLEARADVATTQKQELTPLIIAVKGDHVQVVSSLLTSGASVITADACGFCPLHVAASSTVVTVLLQKQANPMAKTIDKDTPLHVMVRSSRTDAAERLLSQVSNTAELLSARNSSGLSPLDLARNAEPQLPKLMNILEATERSLAGQLLIYACSPRRAPLENVGLEADEVMGHCAAVVSSGSAERLRQTLFNLRPLHFLFAGHADAQFNGERTLAFTDDTGKLSVAQPDALASMLHDVRQNRSDVLQLVFLNGCSSETLGRAVCQQSGVPWVVCWRTPCDDEAARLFSVKFFQALNRRAGYRDAFQQAKSAVQLHTRPGRLASGAFANVPKFVLLDPTKCTPSERRDLALVESDGSDDEQADAPALTAGAAAPPPPPPGKATPAPLLAGVPLLLCKDGEDVLCRE